MKNKNLVKVCAAAAVIALVAAGCAKKSEDPAPTKIETTEAGVGETESEKAESNEPAEDETPAKEDHSVEAEKATEEESKGVFEEFTAQDLDGNEVTQDIFADHEVTMINVWATFCGPCLSEMPELGELSEEYKDKGLQIVGIVSDVLTTPEEISDAKIEEAKEIVEKTKASYLHIVPAGDLAYSLLPQVPAVPTTVFVDKDGKQIGAAVVGAKSKGAWAKVIDETLEKAGAGQN